MDFHGKNVLLVEDDANLGAILSERLKLKGFAVTLAVDGEQGLKAFGEEAFDLCIFDVMMPIKDGFTLAKEVRALNAEIPIIFVTAKSLKEDVIEGFNAGGDDYITKPFSMEELLLRINAVTKRMSTKNEIIAIKQEVFRIGEFDFDFPFQKLHIHGEHFKLTSKESDLLRILSTRVNEVVSREKALKEIWGDDTYFNGRSMDVFISKLRKLLSKDPNVEIMNVHGKGFKLMVREPGSPEPTHDEEEIDAEA